MDDGKKQNAALRMANYSLSGEADTDIQTIAEDSINRWGLARAEAYIMALHETFQKLANFPEIGRDASHIRSGYMQMASASYSHSH